MALAGLKLSHSFFGGSVALHALWLLPLMVLEVVELVLVELAGSELVRARLALVCLQVTRVKPLCTAVIVGFLFGFPVEVYFFGVFRFWLKAISAQHICSHAGSTYP